MQPERDAGVEAAPEVETTALTVIERAAIAVGSKDHEKQLVQLVADAKSITGITNKDGYEEAHATRMRLKNTRISISRIGKAAREDAQAFSAAVIEEERRLIGIIEPEENRLKGLQDAWDAEQEAERQRKIAAERARQQAIRERIETLRRYPMDAVGKDSAAIAGKITECELQVIDEERYAEHTALARQVQADALTALRALLETVRGVEAEQERLRLEREALAAEREQARREQQAREEEARLRREQEVARQESERQQARLRANEQADLLRRREEESRALQEELDKLRRANKEREDREHRAEQERLAAAQASQAVAAPTPIEEAPAPAPVIAETETALAAVPPMLTAPLDAAEQERPSDDDILLVVADHFDVTVAVAREWIIVVGDHLRSEEPTMAAIPAAA